jgi:hypothetical protein
MLWIAGLRGAMSYACSRSFPNSFGHRQDFTIATCWIVLFTVFFLGGTTEFALNRLKVEVNVDEAVYMEKWHLQRQQDGLILSFEDFVNRHAVRQDSQSDSDHFYKEGGPSQSDDRGQHRRTDSAASDVYHNQPLEMTASRHFERLEAMGYVRDTNATTRFRGSLFDFGGDHR